MLVVIVISGLSITIAEWSIIDDFNKSRALDAPLTILLNLFAYLDQYNVRYFLFETPSTCQSN